MSLNLPEEFYQSLSSKFQQSAKSGHLQFNGGSATNEFIQITAGNSKVDFQLTSLESLSKRPDKGSIEKDPFVDPEPELTIVEDFGRDSEFRIVFNKFPVVPNHFMLITKEFKSQNSPLAPSELDATLSILKSLKRNDFSNKWFAFYNCGPSSGASQPHKHIQFMTLPRDGFTPYAERLSQKSEVSSVDKNPEPLQSKDIPFSHFIANLPEDVDQDTLSMYFAWLLQRVLNVCKENNGKDISYNFILTTEYMMLVPRSKSKYNNLGINSCGTMGLILCKDRDLLSMVKDKGPLEVVSDCCYPNSQGKTYDEYDY